MQHESANPDQVVMDESRSGELEELFKRTVDSCGEMLEIIAGKAMDIFKAEDAVQAKIAGKVKDREELNKKLNEGIQQFDATLMNLLHS